MPHNMKSVMIFDPKDSDRQTDTKFANWYRHNQSSVADKYVPSKIETLKMLHEK